MDDEIGLLDEEEDMGDWGISTFDFMDMDRSGWMYNLDFKIHVSEEEEEEENWLLDEEGVNFIWDMVSDLEETNVRNIVLARKQFEGQEERVGEFRDAIHRDYDGVVLCKEVVPNPHVRGLHGQAFITLKEGAIPQRQRPYKQHGEKDEAMKKIAQDWLDKKFIEPPLLRIANGFVKHLQFQKSLPLSPGGGWWT